jgi:uncharacterized protein
MRKDSYEHNVPSWIDLGSPDLPGARAFYGSLFGWDYEDGPPEAGGYTIAMKQGRSVAGLGPQMNPGPPAWMTYIDVADADATAGAVAANGGQVFMAPFDVMDVGRMGVFADPAGAVFGIWQAKTHPGAGLVNEPGTWTWNELVTTDVQGAIAFYGEVFGWGAETHGEGPSAYTEWKVGGSSMAGMMAKSDQIPAEVPPFWGVYFAVEDADRCVAEATGLGGSLMMAPMDIEPGRFAVLADPTGAVFSVIAMKEQPGG